MKNEKLSTQIYNKIKNDLLYLKILPGVVLQEREFANIFSVSRTPIREAIQRLAIEGWVEINSRKVVKVIQVTSRFPGVHGAPVHLGDPSTIGIKNIDCPDFGEPSTINPGEVPVFWACGVTPQVVAMEASLRFMITHSPGHMFITDICEENLSIF